MTSTLPPAQDLRDCHLYRFWVRHPVTGQRALGYVGETVRSPFERLMEHVYSQPWADTILAWEVDEVTYPGKQAVLDAEAAAIRAEHPLYNVRRNERNDQRIIPPDAIRQRRARDAERGKPRWVHPADHPAPVSGTRRGGRVSQPNRWCVDHPVRVKVCLWAITWAATAGIIWGQLSRYGWVSDWRVHAGTAAVSSLALLLWGVLRPRDTARVWRRRLRGIRRLLR